MTTPAAAPLLEGHPAVADIVSYDKRGADAGLAGLLRLGRMLRRRRYARAYLPHRSLRTAALAVLTGATERTGFADGTGAVTYTRRVPRPRTGHETERLLSLAGAAPQPTATPRLALSAADRDAAAEWMRQRGVPEGFVAIAPGSIWGTKRWPYYNELAATLNAPIVVVGGTEDAALAMSYLVDVLLVHAGTAAQAAGAGGGGGDARAVGVAGGGHEVGLGAICAGAGAGRGVAGGVQLGEGAEAVGVPTHTPWHMVLSPGQGDRVVPCGCSGAMGAPTGWQAPTYSATSHASHCPGQWLLQHAVRAESAQAVAAVKRRVARGAGASLLKAEARAGARVVGDPRLEAGVLHAVAGGGAEHGVATERHAGEAVGGAASACSRWSTSARGRRSHCLQVACTSMSLVQLWPASVPAATVPQVPSTPLPLPAAVQERQGSLQGWSQQMPSVQWPEAQSASSAHASPSGRTRISAVSSALPMPSRPPTTRTPRPAIELARVHHGAPWPRRGPARDAAAVKVDANVP